MSDVLFDTYATIKKISLHFKDGSSQPFCQIIHNIVIVFCGRQLYNID